MQPPVLDLSHCVGDELAFLAKPAAMPRVIICKQPFLPVPGGGRMIGEHMRHTAGKMLLLPLEMQEWCEAHLQPGWRVGWAPCELWTTHGHRRAKGLLHAVIRFTSVEDQVLFRLRWSDYEENDTPW